MTVTRRKLLATAGAAAGGHVLLPAVVRAGAAFGQTGPDPASARRNRIVVVFLNGGNDGLNTVVPRGDLPRDPRYSVYRKVRPALHITPQNALALDRPGDRDEKLGLHPSLKALHRLYREHRLAIVQGVDYPNHNYSHFESADIWHSGEPEDRPDTGWLGRHLDRAGIGEGELRALAISWQMPLMLRGQSSAGLQLTSIESARFADGSDGEGDARHQALALFRNHPRSEPVRLAAGRVCSQTVGMVEDLERAKLPPGTENALVNVLLTARVLLEQNLGVESVFVDTDGYDTHTDQAGNHTVLLSRLDAAVEAFFYGTAAGTPTGAGPMPAALAQRTILMVVSEFGRRIGENGTGVGAGTDHGAAAPVFIAGPSGRSPATGRRLVPGLHGEHPPLGSTAAPADDLVMTTDLRRVYQAVLENWLQDPDPDYRTRQRARPGLFA